MKLSRESRYAIEALVVLARKPLGGPVQLRDIARAAKIPPSFLAKIFQKLNRANIVTSSRGAVRGYTLSHKPQAIEIADIFTVVEGSDVFDRCIFWSDRCTDRAPCAMHADWVRMRRAIIDLMHRTSLADLAVNKRGNAKRSRHQSRGGTPE